MARQTQYQTHTEPVAFDAIEVPSFVASVYPDSFPKKRNESLNYFVTPLSFDSPVVDPGNGSGFFRTRQLQYQIFTEPLFVVSTAIPELVSSIYPELVTRKYTDRLSYFVDPIQVPEVPVVVPDFIQVITDIRGRNRLREEVLYKVEPVYFEDTHLINIVFPDTVERRKYKHHEFVFRTNRVIIPSVNDKQSLILITSLSARLDVRREVDSGIANCLAADVGGTVVTFNKAFKDVDGITLGVNDTVEKKAIFDFVDIPDPVSFKILVYNVAGARVDAQVRWMARGII